MKEYILENWYIILPLVFLTISEIFYMIKGRPDEAIKAQRKKEKLQRKITKNRDKAEKNFIKNETKLQQIKKENEKNDNSGVKE